MKEKTNMTNFDFRKFRRVMGVSARALAKLLGSNVCSIYNFEKGRTSPRGELIEKRAYALQKVIQSILLDPDYLVKLFDKLNKSVDNQ